MKTRYFLHQAREALRVLTYYLTGPLRIRQLEKRVHLLESDFYDQQRRFAATVAFYERRIELIIATHSRSEQKSAQRDVDA